MPETPPLQEYNIDIQDSAHKVRLDKVLSHALEDITRSRIKSLILERHVCVDGQVVDNPSYKVLNGQSVRVIVPPAQAYHVVPQDIPLDILYEDDDLLVINKDADMVVHPAAGNWSGTLVHALLHHCGDTLSGIGGVLRPGIVHRLDRGTSGVMLVAKNDYTHQHLSEQLKARTLKRIYQTLVCGDIIPPIGEIEYPIGRHPKDRLKKAVRLEGGRFAKTHYKKLEDYRRAVSLVECSLETGRTHQIRVHMEYVRSYMIGDPLYGPQRTYLNALLKKAEYHEEVRLSVLDFPRQALHAKAISFIHPRREEVLRLESALPNDLQNIIKLLKNNNK